MNAESQIVVPFSTSPDQLVSLLNQDRGELVAFVERDLDKIPDSDPFFATLNKSFKELGLDTSGIHGKDALLTILRQLPKDIDFSSWSKKDQATFDKAIRPLTELNVSSVPMIQNAGGSQKGGFRLLVLALVAAFAVIYENTRTAFKAVHEGEVDNQYAVIARNRYDSKYNSKAVYVPDETAIRECEMDPSIRTSKCRPYDERKWKEAQAEALEAGKKAVEDNKVKDRQDARVVAERIWDGHGSAWFAYQLTIPAILTFATLVTYAVGLDYHLRVEHRGAPDPALRSSYLRFTDYAYILIEAQKTRDWRLAYRMIFSGMTYNQFMDAEGDEDMRRLRDTTLVIEEQRRMRQECTRMLQTTINACDPIENTEEARNNAERAYRDANAWLAGLEGRGNAFRDERDAVQNARRILETVPEDLVRMREAVNIVPEMEQLAEFQTTFERILERGQALYRELAEIEDERRRDMDRERATRRELETHVNIIQDLLEGATEILNELRERRRVIDAAVVSIQDKIRRSRAAVQQEIDGRRQRADVIRRRIRVEIEQGRNAFRAYRTRVQAFPATMRASHANLTEHHQRVFNAFKIVSEEIEATQVRGHQNQGFLNQALPLRNQLEQIVSQIRPILNETSKALTRLFVQPAGLVAEFTQEEGRAREAFDNLQELLRMDDRDVILHQEDHNVMLRDILQGLTTFKARIHDVDQAEVQRVIDQVGPTDETKRQAITLIQRSDPIGFQERVARRLLQQPAERLLISDDMGWTSAQQFQQILEDQPRLPIPAEYGGGRFQGYSKFMCPICLNPHFAYDNQCIYKSEHQCRPLRNNVLYQKYLFVQGGNNQLCSTCGTPCNRYHHYIITDPRLNDVPALGGSGFDPDNCGGGNRHVMIARLLGIIECVNGLPDPIEKNNAFIQACTEAGERAAVNQAMLQRADACLRTRRFDVQFQRKYYEIPARVAADPTFTDPLVLPLGYDIETVPGGECSQCVEALNEIPDQAVAGRPVYRLTHPYTRDGVVHIIRHADNQLYCLDHMAASPVETRRCFLGDATCMGKIHPSQLSMLLQDGCIINPQYRVQERHTCREIFDGFAFRFLHAGYTIIDYERRLMPAPPPGAAGGGHRHTRRRRSQTRRRPIRGALRHRNTRHR